MPIIMPDNTVFVPHPDGFGGTDADSHLDNRAHVALRTERTAMAIDPPTAGPLASLTLEGLTKLLQTAEKAAAEAPALRAELAERMAEMFPGQKLVKARKAKGTP